MNVTTSVPALLLLGLFIPQYIHAELLPITAYTTREGLTHNRIKSIQTDRHGYLWFGTNDGFGRFDGSRFLNFNVEHGLPHPNINQILQSRDGKYWIATNGGGVCTFDPSSIKTSSAPNTSYFVVHRIGKSEISNRVNVLYQDDLHRIWAGTDDGLFRYDPRQKEIRFHYMEIGLRRDHSEEVAVTSMIGDRHGAIWIGTGGSGLYRISRNGIIERFGSEQSFPVYPTIVWCLMEDQRGNIWVGTSDGLYQLIPNPHTKDKNIVAHAYHNSKDLNLYSRALRQSADGKIWIGTSSGLLVFDGQDFRRYTTINGLSQDDITSIAFDRDQNVWIGTSISGVNKIAEHGLTTFGKMDGLTNLQTNSFFENASGKLFAASGNWTVHGFDGTRFVAARPSFPTQIIDAGWWWQQNMLLDRQDQWWIATNKGLFQFPAARTIERLDNSIPKAVYTSRDGLASDNVQAFFEDSRGDLWISATTSNRTGLSRLEIATGKLHHYSSANGLPDENWPTAFCEDRKGNVWIGFYYGGLARYENGRFHFFPATDNLPKGPVRKLYTDQRGWIWIATEHSGVRCIRNPASERLQFASYTAKDGLSSNSTWCFTEDNLDHVFVGTSRGLDALDLRNNSIRNYSVTDGLADNFVQAAFRDHQGVLWFGTPKGISRLIPSVHRDLSLPEILISGLKVAGAAQPLSLSGESQVSGLVLNPDQNDLEIHSTSLSFQPVDQLRYRYMLEGAEEDWSAWNDQNTVHFARLAPGQYQYFVQSKNADGGISPVPARVAFTILRPFWQRWWFLTIAAAFLTALVYAIYRYRIFQLLRLERVRTQIASDLHDDIGLSLSHIAVLSEVLRKKATNGGADLSESLVQIARISREAVDSMSDIVWAINPQKDRMMDLERRMHHAANEILFVRDIVVSFQAAERGENLRVATNVRREVLLIFKEALNNIVRHSGCSKVRIDLSINGRNLLLQIVDDGKGFDLNSNHEGNGLINIRKRAKNVNGVLKIQSSPGSGTKIELKVPLR